MAEPQATADIGSGIRITSLRTPVIDAEAGVCSSIRKVNAATVIREKLVGTTLTEEMMAFLELCLTHGVSM